jgi:hypothetical protein
LNIIDQHFSDDLSLSHGELRRLTGLPIEYIKKKSERDKISVFPRHLLEYIDARDINFKTIRDLLTFDYTLLDWLSGWISSIQIRVNIFKKITEHLFDIARNGKTADIPLHGDGRIKNDSDLHAEVFRVRYPHYSSMNYKASEIINKISSPEVSIGFPEFFEKNHILITLKIFKNNRKGEWRKNIESVSNEDIDELLKLIE